MSQDDGHGDYNNTRHTAVDPAAQDFSLSGLLQGLTSSIFQGRSAGAVHANACLCLYCWHREMVTEGIHLLDSFVST